MNHAAIEIETVRRPAQRHKLRNATLNGTGMPSPKLENALEQKARRLKRGILIAWLAACALAVSFFGVEGGVSFETTATLGTFP